MQALLDGFFGGHLALLPKRFNVEMRFWDGAHAAWRDAQRMAHGEVAVPAEPMGTGAGVATAAPAEGTAAGTAGARHSLLMLHFVGRDKPWMRYERSRVPDTEQDLCRRLREKDEATCAAYLRTQALWWAAFGAGRCLLVGEAAAGKAQGFVVQALSLIHI